MNEIKRIIGNRRLLFGLVLILLVNGLLFMKEQAAKDYGMNLILPSLRFVFLLLAMVL